MIGGQSYVQGCRHESPRQNTVRLKLMKHNRNTKFRGMVQ